MFGLFSQRAHGAHALIAGLAGAAGLAASAREVGRESIRLPGIGRKVRDHGRHNGTHGSTRIRRHRSLKAKAGAR